MSKTGYAAGIEAFLNSQEFYEICQTYRHAGDPHPKALGLMNAADAFVHIKEQILAALPSPESSAEPVCQTCNGNSVVSGHAQDGSYDDMPCPDCSAAPAAHGMQWVSVEDRLPEDNREYLVSVVAAKGRYTTTSMLNPAKTGFYVEYDTDGVNPVEAVTHWMPLPQPPEAAKGATK